MLTIQEAERRYAAAPSDEAWHALKAAREADERQSVGSRLSAVKAEEERKAALLAEYRALEKAANPAPVRAACLEDAKIIREARAAASAAENRIRQRIADHDAAGYAVWLFAYKNKLPGHDNSGMAPRHLRLSLNDALSAEGTK